MAISSISLTYVNMSGMPSASTPVGAVAPAANDDATTKKASCEGHEPRRRNVLFDAMMSALRELGLAKPASQGSATTTGTPAAPAAGSTPAGTPADATGAAPTTGATPATDAAPGTAPATTAAASLEDAVLSFAHALWQALRGDEGSNQRRGRDDDDGDHHRRHHHHHGHHHGRDYAGLASRIEALAVRIETAAPGAAPAVTSPAGTPPKLPGTDPVPMDVAAPTTAANAATSGAVATSGAIATPAAPAEVTAPAKGSLAESFAAMLKLLRGGDQTTGPTAPEASLATFLHSLARGLDADRSAPSMTVVGVMINVSA